MNKSNNRGGADLSPGQRKRLVAAFRVKYPRRSAVMAMLEKAMEDSKYSADPVCVFIGGDTGAGKSTLAQSFADNHPEVKGEEVDRLPVLLTSLPPASSRKDAASQILLKLGDQRAFSGQLNDMTHRLLKYIHAKQVEMVVLDEFQHLIDRDSDRVNSKTADWVKGLIIESKKPFALIGMPDALRIFEVNPQLGRRFSRRMLIPPLSWSPEDGPDSDPSELESFLAIVDGQLPFAQSAGLDNQKTVAWFHENTGGVLGLVMRLVREGASLAIDRGADRLEKLDLKAALAQMTIDKKDIRPTPKNGKKRRAQDPNIGEVLRA